ncbi:uncharacterized protein A4U43_C03F14800 [Asparagus officinalis]|uniref:Major facilitator superfamily (MFS) profile domain-containing protein n=1 Tax=Asparagus officinalis TaxID=4686 RepID=A0A5P1FA45_ASPOF|nr:sugar transport protein 8-like [Asparagus officinalis]XP_020255221.1 sugar transport protein 8-like [Asparagus officinalis]ONK75238.1 uncharacterized protein A4U43_C03F14800 [Asparagus officinalis]
MAPPVVTSGIEKEEFEGKITFYVVVCAIMAATGGLMFGYDVGISGGVTSMDDFLEKFFHGVYIKKHRAYEDNYCKYDNHGLQLFTSSLYLAAIFSSFIASKTCTKFGRRLTMQAASMLFLAGTILNASAQNLAMLIAGRLLLGLGVGCANQAIPLFLSEIAPVKHRGGLNVLFQLAVTIGILVANLINYGATSIHPWGWRLALGLAGVPASLLCIGSFIITETPTSLIERNKHEQGLAALKKIRGTDNVLAEYDEIVHACEVANEVKHPFKNLMHRSNRPPLVIGIWMQIFQQFTGINAIMFYAPVLFQTVGFKNNASLLSAVITGTVNVGCTIISVMYVDKAGRRTLLLSACVLMLIAQTTIGGILQAYLKSTNNLDRNVAVAVVAFVCIYVGSFAWSWGPLGWLIPSETFPLETRTAGYACAVSTNMLFTFLIAQAFLSMLCHMRASIFFFFSGWILVMSFFVIFLLPETKNIPIEEMVDRVWKNHWLWKRFMNDNKNDDRKVSKLERGASR